MDGRKLVWRSAELPTLSSIDPVSKEIEVKDGLDQKASVPIVVTPAGIVMEVRLVPLKAFSPILVRLDGV